MGDPCLDLLRVGTGEYSIYDRGDANTKLRIVLRAFLFVKWRQDDQSQITVQHADFFT